MKELKVTFVDRGIGWNYTFIDIDSNAPDHFSAKIKEIKAVCDEIVKVLGELKSK